MHHKGNAGILNEQTVWLPTQRKVKESADHSRDVSRERFRIRVRASFDGLLQVMVHWERKFYTASSTTNNHNLQRWNENVELDIELSGIMCRIDRRRPWSHHCYKNGLTDFVKCNLCEDVSCNSGELGIQTFIGCSEDACRFLMTSSLSTKLQKRRVLSETSAFFAGMRAYPRHSRKYCIWDCCRSSLGSCHSRKSKSPTWRQAWLV